GVDFDRNEMLILERQLPVVGPSRALVNGRTVPIKVLGEVGSRLIEIFAHNSASALLETTSHRSLLDAFANVATVVSDVQQKFAAYEGFRRRADAMATEKAELERRREWLLFVIEDLDVLSAEPGEATVLADERKLLLQSAKLHGFLSEAQTALDGPAVESALSIALKALEGLRALIPEEMKDISDDCRQAYDAADRANIELYEARQSVANLSRHLEHEPSLLSKIETRLFDLRSAGRKHKCDPDGLAEYLIQCRSEYDLLDAQAVELEGVETQIRTAFEAYHSAAEALSSQRKTAAARLEQAVLAELGPLHLEKVGFRVEVSRLEHSEIGAFGLDRVEFLADTRTGSGFGPLRKIASSGELARFALALKCALSETQTSCTLFFDEADQGVGGSVAASIGQRLRRLSTGRQVLAITHAPQVASAADHQWQVRKSATNHTMLSQLNILNETDRLEEIARMLSGSSVTDEARAAASKLLEVA
ncbi:MAG: DNA repair protein RecN, partial [Pseudomonadota bacterium]